MGSKKKKKKEPCRRKGGKGRGGKPVVGEDRSENFFSLFCFPFVRSPGRKKKETERSKKQEKEWGE